MKQLENIVNRAAEATGVYGRLRILPSQVDKLALATLGAQAANQQLDMFAHWCYQRHDWLMLNILSTGQIPPGAWCPWGGSGKSRMPKADRWMLRQWLLEKASNRQFPPWRYSEDERRWYVDLVRYPALTETLGWLANHRIESGEWLKLRLSVPTSKRK